MRETRMGSLRMSGVAIDVSHFEDSLVRGLADRARSAKRRRRLCRAVTYVSNV